MTAVEPVGGLDTEEARATEIGRRIAQARKEAGGMTQGELAVLVGLSERSIQAYELGDVIPYRYMRELAGALGKSVEWLLHGEAAEVSSNEQFGRILEDLAELKKLVRALKR